MYDIRMHFGSPRSTPIFDAVLDDSPLAARFAAMLPVSIEMHRWGDEYYGSCELSPFDGVPEMREIMEVGELAFWPDGDALCLFFGRTPVSTDSRPRAVTPVVPLGRVKGVLRELARLPAVVTVRIEAAAEASDVPKEAIVPDLASTTKTEAIHELIVRSGAFASVHDVAALERSILAREERMTTGLGRGVAITHGESDEVDGVAVALGLSKGGIEYDSMDGRPVRILVLIVNRAGERGGYLELLSSLTTMLRDESIREMLQSCDCVDDVETALSEGARRYSRRR